MHEHDLWEQRVDLGNDLKCRRVPAAELRIAEERFCEQQFLHFAFGKHRRVGAASSVRCLVDDLVILIDAELRGEKFSMA